MSQYTVKYQQSLLDIALQELGDASAVVPLAVLNNMSITENLEAGQSLQLPEEITRPEVVRYFIFIERTLATNIL
ncbi:MAG: hypothetical protein OHK0045_11720 [Raineya sp.]